MPVFAAPGSPAYRRTTFALFLVGFTTFALLYCVQPLLPLLAHGFGVSPAASSLVLAVSTAALALAILMAGPYSEWVGRRGLMIVALGTAALCDIAAAFMPDWHMLLLVRALEGYALGGVPAVAMTYLAEEIEPRGLGAAMGVYVSGTALGGMTGRVTAGLIADVSDWRMAVGVVGALGLALTLLFALLLPPSRNFIAKPGFRPRYHFGAWLGHLKRPGLPSLFLLGGLLLGVFITLYNYGTFLLAAPPYNLGQAETGLIFTVFLAGYFTSPRAGKLSDRLGLRPVLLGALGLFLLGVVMTLLPPLPLVILGIALATGGFFAAHTVTSSWVGTLGASDRAHAASLYLFTYYVGSSVMGVVGGWFWTAHGWFGVTVFCGAALLLALVLAIRLQPRPR
jgi:YNFM family putative membrane transporter